VTCTLVSPNETLNEFLPSTWWKGTPDDFNRRRHNGLGAWLRCGTEQGDKRKLMEILTSVGVEGEQSESEKTASTVWAQRQAGGGVLATFHRSSGSGRKLPRLGASSRVSWWRSLAPVGLHAYELSSDRRRAWHSVMRLR
jgi:hypothetical protein